MVYLLRLMQQTKLYNVTKKEDEKSSSTFLYLRQPQTNQNEDWIKKLFDRLYNGISDTNRRAKFLARKGFDDEKVVIDPFNFDTRPDYYSDINRYILSCVYAIGSSSDHPGESTLAFYRLAKQRHNRYASPQFTRYNVPKKVFDKYSQRLAQAAVSFREACSAGVILQISLSPSLADKSVYPALPGGFKHNIYAKTGNKKIESVSELFKESRNQPFNIFVKRHEEDCTGLDPLQFRLIVDNTLLLNPNDPEVKKGFSVKAYTGQSGCIEKFHNDVEKIMQELRIDLGSQMNNY